MGLRMGLPIGAMCLLTAVSGCGRVGFDELLLPAQDGGEADRQDGGTPDGGELDAAGTSVDAFAGGVDASALRSAVFGDGDGVPGVTTETNLRSDEPRVNFATSTRLTISSTPIRTGLIRIDLTGTVPANATVQSAVLVVRVPNGILEPWNINLHPVTEEWREDEATWEERTSGVPWTTEGGSHDPSVLVGSFSPRDREWRFVDLDVATVQEWVSEPTTNLGLHVSIDPGGGTAEISTSEHTTASTRPSLRIDWTEP